MKEAIINGIANGTARLIVTFPLAVLVLHCFVWWGWLAWAEIPEPTTRQILIIAAAIALVS